MRKKVIYVHFYKIKKILVKSVIIYKLITAQECSLKFLRAMFIIEKTFELGVSLYISYKSFFPPL